MRISIEFDSCWQTSFLDGDHDLQISKTNPRKFVATAKTRGEEPAPITKNTVIGVLCRLIGDQRKLYQARNSENYYFSDIEEHVSFSLIRNESTTQELMYLTNKSDDRCAQSSFLGVLSADNPWFFSTVAPKLWPVLFLDKHKLLDFILYKEAETSAVDCTPKNLMARVDVLSNTKNDAGSVLMTKNRLLSEKLKEIENKQKILDSTIEKVENKPLKTDDQLAKHQTKLNGINEAIKFLKEELKQIESDPEVNECDTKIKAVVESLSHKFPDCEYLVKEAIYPVSLYAAALYLQAERLLKIRNDLDFVKDRNGNIQIQGFSKRGFNGIRDWLNPMTGKRKKAVGTPCRVQKQSGSLDITIDVSREKAKELKKLIENAGVSSFFFGKKGLAHITDIDTREVKH